MTKIKLGNGSVINANSVKVENGVLKITTSDLTVEELAELFTDKDNTCAITLLTESGNECGYKSGFTSFAGIAYDPEGVKTIELFQPADALESRVSKTEATIAWLDEELTNTQMALVEQYEENLALQEEITNAQLALCEIYEGMEV